ncbi:hypothetical protein GS421_08745 [Rhodococcus hoagii]|nr:hypothetical protein [Prescottella equi]
MAANTLGSLSTNSASAGASVRDEIRANCRGIARASTADRGRTPPRAPDNPPTSA